MKRIQRSIDGVVRYIVAVAADRNPAHYILDLVGGTPRALFSGAVHYYYASGHDVRLTYYNISRVLIIFYALGAFAPRFALTSHNLRPTTYLTY